MKEWASQNKLAFSDTDSAELLVVLSRQDNRLFSHFFTVYTVACVVLAEHLMYLASSY